MSNSSNNNVPYILAVAIAITVFIVQLIQFINWMERKAHIYLTHVNGSV